jgi:hypothetical protein
LGLEDAKKGDPLLYAGRLNHLFDKAVGAFAGHLVISGSTAHSSSLPRFFPAKTRGAIVPPPIPATPDARAQRNYFAYGIDSGLQRLKNDAALSLRHFFGQSQTIGDPYGKASHVFLQKGGSCVIAARFQALRVRNRPGVTSMEDVVKLARDQGFYVEYHGPGKKGSGATTLQGNALLEHYGVHAKVLPGDVISQLDVAIRVSKYHDAIIDVNEKFYKNDRSLPDGPVHDVYVTGEEVDARGRVLGFYVNDTGTGEGARFIPVDVCRRAFHEVVALDSAPGKGQ